MADQLNLKQHNDAVLDAVANAIRITKDAIEDIDEQGLMLEAIRWYQEQLERELFANRIVYDINEFNRKTMAR